MTASREERVARLEEQVQRALAEEPPPTPEESAYIEKLLAEAPPLSQEQKDTIVAILRGGEAA
jgi:hypothetical protein